MHTLGNWPRCRQGLNLLPFILPIASSECLELLKFDKRNLHSFFANWHCAVTEIEIDRRKMLLLSPSPSTSSLQPPECNLVKFTIGSWDEQKPKESSRAKKKVMICVGKQTQLKAFNCSFHENQRLLFGEQVNFLTKTVYLLRKFKTRFLKFQRILNLLTTTHHA